MYVSRVEVVVIVKFQRMGCGSSIPEVAEEGMYSVKVSGAKRVECNELYEVNKCDRSRTEEQSSEEGEGDNVTEVAGSISSCGFL